MNARLSPAQSRALALALLLLVIFALVAAVALPTWLLHKRYDGYLQDHIERLTGYRKVAAQRPVIEQEIKAVAARAARQNYLKGASPAAVAAELQGMVTRIVENHKGKIISSQALSAQAGGKTAVPAKAAISMLMIATTDSLLHVLHALETNQPYLFVDKLTVRAGRGRGFGPVPGAEPEYQVQLTVSGFASAGGGKP